MKFSDALKRKAKAAMLVTSAKAQGLMSKVQGLGWATVAGYVALFNEVSAAGITCPTVTGAVAGTTACEVAQAVDFSNMTVAIAVVITALIAVAVVIRALWNVFFAVKPGKMR
jgi:hypothetical protein